MNTLIQGSFWAKNNKANAISILILSKLLLAVLAFYTGLCLTPVWLKSPLSDCLEWLAALLAAGCLLLYPVPKNTRQPGWKTNYIRRKTGDFLLSIIAFGFWFNFGLDVQNQLRDQVSAQVTMPNEAQRTSSIGMLEKQEPVYHHKINRFRKWMISRVERKLGKLIQRHQKTWNELDTGYQLFIGLLLMLLAGILIYLIVSFACNLACSGQEALALLVLIVGVGGVIAGLSFLIKQITGMNKNDQSAPVPNGG